VQTNKLKYNQIPGIFWTLDTSEMQKNTSYLLLKSWSLSSLGGFTVQA